MSRYGIDYYGLATYGSDNPVTFDATPFTATPSKQGEILLNWVDPTGNWSRLVIIRNPYGFPIDPWDGTQILSVYNGADPVVFIDTNLVQGQFYYYSIFVYSLAEYAWVNAGKTLALSVKNCGNTERLYEYLPNIYKITTPYTPTSDWDNPHLYDFLRNFGFELDYDQTITDLMRERYNIEKVSGKLIPTMMNQFGQTYEPAISLQQNRKILRDSVNLTKQKGSKDGLIAFIKDFTGWAIPEPIAGTPNPSVSGITMGKNLMLDYNDSSFEESIGHWHSDDGTALLDALHILDITSFKLVSNVATLYIGPNEYDVGNQIVVSGLPYPLFNSATPVTLTAVDQNSYVSYSLTGPDVPLTSGYNQSTEAYGRVTPSPIPWVEPTAPALFPNRATGILAIYNAGAVTQTISAFVGDDAPITKGIPVTGGQTYTFSLYASRGNFTARTVTAKIKWYDRFGTLLSTSSGSGVSDTVTNFNSSTRPYVSAAAPASAYYACPGVSIASVANLASDEHHYIDACQFEKSNSATDFEETRLIKVILRANRINELVNPNFANAGSPWTVTGGTKTMMTNTYEPTSEVFTITAGSITSNIATITLNNAHSYKVGDTVVISGVTGGSAGDYNGSRVITAVTLKTFSYAVTASNSSITSGTVYEAGTSLKAVASSTSMTIASWDGSTNSQQMGIYYPDTSYTFSVYAQALTATESAVVSIKWYNSSHTLISTSSGTATSVPTGAWTRLSLIATAPTTTAYATVQVVFTTTATNEILLDLAVFENAASVLDYFDGSNGPAGQYDLIWEGNALNAGRSHYYKNRLNTQTRLIGATLDAVLPMGSSIATYIAQPLT